MHAVQPEDLREAFVLGLLGRVEARRVVGRGLGLAEPARHRAHVVVDDLDLRRREALRVIRPDRREDHVIQILLRRAHAEERLAGDDRRADVERGADGRRDPVAVDVHQGGPRVQDELGIEGRDRHARGGAVQPLHVLLRPKEPDGAVPATEGLEPLEQRLAARRLRDPDRVSHCLPPHLIVARPPQRRSPAKALRRQIKR